MVGIVAAGVSRSTVINYKTALRSLAAFSLVVGDSASMTADTMVAYQKWLAGKGIRRNSSSCYIRSLRSLYRRIYPEAGNPFSGVFTGNERTRKRALSATVMAQFAASAPCRDSSLRLWYDVFIFSFLGLGIPFADLARLSNTDVSDDVIVYHRRKTSQKITVPLLPEMCEIISRYKGRSPCGLLFPILPSADCGWQTYHNSLARYNRALHRLSVSAGLPEDITSYVARHTWASLANASGISLHHISQALGHNDIKTTEIYLARIPDTEMRRNSVAVANAVADAMYR
ncbi:MAG: site-specific integrase [Bacteroidales bacterium]|nr:site-specific integrase [Bacteroidales bacterium]MCM1146289.1 site-specific integrase [Bacteroidales bacterium]MCM1205273.1 site-specific integrase [Bacillota bacterium]MCM1509640.1 site-specific integrase [Clostridium sp.]